MKNEKIKYLDYQLIGLIITLGLTAMSILITYNFKLYLKKENTIISIDNEHFFKISNNVIILLVSLLFLYINYKQQNLAKERNENITTYQLQIIASMLYTIAAIIVLYVQFISKNNLIVDVENPNL